jgi:signal transduction histidine kinase
VPRLAGLRRWLATPRWVLFDLAVAVGLAFATFSKVGPDGLGWWIFGIPMMAGLLVRRRWPVTAVILTGGAALINHLDPQVSVGPLDLAVPLTFYTLAGSGLSRRRAALILGAALVCVSLLSAVQLMITSGQAADDAQRSAQQSATQAKAEAAAELDVPTKPKTAFKGSPPSAGSLAAAAVGRVLSVILGLGLAFAIGDGVHSRRAHLRTIEKRAADLEREQQQRVALAMAAERARITRELHDVVAHGLSVMVVQAQGGAAALRRHPDRTEHALQNVITTGRTSLAEMRRLLDLVRQDPAEDAQRAPQPGVGALPDLVDRVRATGAGVTFTVDGDPVPLPLSVDLSAYRIVQEALTNTIKHAGTGATARVTLGFREDDLEIEVADDGIGGPVPQGGNGSGLRGIAERVGILGGELSAGPGESGGFLVHASLPLHGAQA